MKVYTKKGDKGKTSLIGGDRVDKDHIRIEAYGTVDELNSWIGLLRDQDIPAESRSELLEVQDRLFTIGSQLAATPDSKMELPQVFPSDITRLELAIDDMEAKLEPMKNFVLPGGHIIVSQCHITRCVCRRAERKVTKMGREGMVKQEEIPSYLNRLSDYLFVLARFLTLELEADETPWKPRK